MNHDIARVSTRLLPIILVSVVIPLVAQTSPERSSDTAHRCRGGVPFEPASLEPPPLMEGIGSSELKITTSSPLTQRYFNQGVNLLHAFWDFEAYRAFREAARHDPDAPMPYWGMYKALGLNAAEMAEERSRALERALELSPWASERERHYIRAAELRATEGKRAFVGEMEALIDRFPEDVEAKLFLANALSTSPTSYAPDGRPREGKLYGQAILRNLLATHPGHAAVHHYWIHAVENGPRPGEALESAKRLPRLAPGSGHLVHMPGHIYYRLGRYDDARAAFLRSREVDVAYMDEQGVSPVAMWNYVHNLDYLVGNCAEDGRLAEGLEYAAELESVEIAERRLAARGAGYTLYGGQTAAARLLMRYGRWAEAATRLDSVLEDSGASEISRSYLEGLLAYLEGRDAAARDDHDRAAASAASLTRIISGMEHQRPGRGSDWYAGFAEKILRVHQLELTGIMLSSQGRAMEAIESLEKAIEAERELGYWEPPHYARPVVETLAAIHYDHGDHDKAIDAWNHALALRPNSGHALFGLARAYAGAGRVEQARQTYREFLTAWRGADRRLPQLEQAREWLARSGQEATAPIRRP